MRPGDWIKNVFVLPAPVAAGAVAEEFDPGLIAATAAAFAAFCLVASGFYAVNDVADAESDRRHPIKRRRPVASGDVAPAAALVLGAVLVAAGLAIGFAVNATLGWVLTAYAGLQVAYNARIKRVLFVDVVAVAIGFGLRAAAGAVAIEVTVSVWLILCVFFLCLYLAFIKRLCDISSAEAAGAAEWRTPAGYDRGEMSWLLAITAVMAVMTYLVYALSEHARSIFGNRAIALALMSPLVLIVIHRFYRRANVGASDSPFAVFRDDRAVIASVVLFVLLTLATFYVPQVEEIIERIFADARDSRLP
jgi:decaprenyl-phosphate phosphoribosyltransferase